MSTNTKEIAAIRTDKEKFDPNYENIQWSEKKEVRSCEECASEETKEDCYSCNYNLCNFKRKEDARKD